ncbi:MAG: hypothetical protein AAGA56_07075 [Myxococcota bacterium]
MGRWTSVDRDTLLSMRGVGSSLRRASLGWVWLSGCGLATGDYFIDEPAELGTPATSDAPGEAVEPATASGGEGGAIASHARFDFAP